MAKLRPSRLQRRLDRDNTLRVGEGVGLGPVAAGKGDERARLGDGSCTGKVDAERLRGGGGVDQLHVDRALRRVIGDGVEEMIARAGECGRRDFGAEVLGEHGLRVVAGRAVAGHGVVADQVGLPLHAAGVDVDEERRVGGHDDQVAVALHAGHPRGVAKRRAHVGGGRAFARGPLADEDLWPVAVFVVVVVYVGKELVGALVVVVVEHVGLHALQRRGGDQLQLRVLRLDGLRELRVTALVAA